MARSEWDPETLLERKSARRAAQHEGRHGPQALYDEAKKDGWIVISMKNDWTRILTFEP
jgi:hypothetical protein